MKRLFSPITGLLAIALFALSLGGCQKEEAVQPFFNSESVDHGVNFRGTGVCDPGVKLLKLFNAGGNNNVVRLYENSLQPENQPEQSQNISSDLPSLLQFSANSGKVIQINNQEMAVKDSLGPPGGGSDGQWIDPGEILYIKAGTNLTSDNWRFLTANLYLEVKANTTVRLQMRSNGQNVQPPVIKSYAAAGFVRLSLSLFYHWNEIALSIDGMTGGVNLPLKSAQAERQCFIITNNTNDFIAMRQRDGLYFWNSAVDNDHVGVFKPNHQYLIPSTGQFGLTVPDGNQWMDVSATPGFVNRHKSGSAFGPANPLSPGVDYGVNNGESMSLKIGSSLAGETFSNVVVPIFKPVNNAATTRIILLKGGMEVLPPFNLTQLAGTFMYHLIGAVGADFDEIVFTTDSATSPQNYYEVRTDYWSVLRFSKCQGGGGLIANPPSQIEDVPVEINME